MSNSNATTSLASPQPLLRGNLFGAHASSTAAGNAPAKLSPIASREARSTRSATRHAARTRKTSSNASPEGTAQAAAWTRRTRQTENSSADEEDEGPPYPMDSPSSETGDSSRMTTRSSVPQKRSSHSSTPAQRTGPLASTPLPTHMRRPEPFLHKLNGAAQHQQQQQHQQQPSFAAHALEHHFAQVSMTPPANFGSHAYRESPFAGPSASTGWSTEVRRIPQSGPSRMTRTSAFGPLAPLQTHGEEAEDVCQSGSSAFDAADDRSIGHGTSSFTSFSDHDDEDSSSTSADERPYFQTSPSIHAAKLKLGRDLGTAPRRTRARTSDIFDSSSSAGGSFAERRRVAPAFLITTRASDDHLSRSGSAMDLDSDAEFGAPASPTPLGDSSFTSGGSPDGSESTSPFLQPGPLSQLGLDTVSRRMTPPGGERLLAPHTAPSLSQLSASSSSPRTDISPIPRRRTSPTLVSTRSSRHATASSSVSSSSSPDQSSSGSASMKQSRSATSPYPVKRRFNEMAGGARTRAISSIEDQLHGSPSSVCSSNLSLHGHHGHGGFSGQRFDDTQDHFIAPAVTPSIKEQRRRVASNTRSAKMDKSHLPRLQGPSFGAGAASPFKPSPARGDDSGINLSFTSVDELAATPFRKGDRLLSHRLGFDDTPEKTYLAPPVPASRARKSASYDSFTTPAKPKPAGVNHRNAHNPFGPIHRSSLANEAKLASTPSGTDSTCSSPDQGSHWTSSVPEGLSTADAPQPYLTPQNFKNIKPLQTAFMSTGLVSKRARGPPTGGADGDLVPLPPRPNFASASNAQTGSASSLGAATGGSMAAAMGLREVVAATSARASLGAGQQQGGSAGVPDTPIKKPVGGLAQHLMGSGGQLGSATRQPPPSVLRPTASRPNLGASCLSSSFPPQQDDNTTDCESPVLGDSCDSPTMNLLSVSNSSGSGNCLTNSKTPDWPQFSMLPPERKSPLMQSGGFFRRMPRSLSKSSLANSTASEDEGSSPIVAQEPAPVTTSNPTRQPLRRIKTNAAVPPAPSASSNRMAALRPAPLRSMSEQMQAGSRTRSRFSDPPVNGESAASDSEGAPAPRPSFMRHRSRPGFGLQRKASFGIGADPAFPQSGVASPTMGLFTIPSTPTRSAGAQIKWFEAARLVTTPSPPSHRQSKSSLRYSQGGIKSKGSNATLVLPSNPRYSTLRHDSDLGRFESNFTQVTVLGSGEFSEAVKVEEKATGSVYAIKRMKRRFTGPKDRLRHLEEVDILRHLNSHPNVVSLQDAWEEDSHLFIQTELCPLGTLAFFLAGYGYMVGHLDEPRLWKVLAELASGLQHIHSRGVLHLDLKPANIFITDLGSIKIGDFGLASRWPPVDPAQILAGAMVGPTDPAAAGLSLPKSNSDGHNARRQRRGSKGVNLEREGDREYLAPEIILEGRYSKAADIFSLGLIMVEAVGNVVMPDNGEPWQKLRNDDLSDVDFSTISVSLYRLIRSMLSSIPHKRPTVDEILAHPVLMAVQERMRKGLDASELDQLPDFELPRKDSGLSTIESAGSLSGDGHDGARSETVGLALDIGPSHDGPSALGLTGTSPCASFEEGPMYRPASPAAARCLPSASSGEVPPMALDVRGALIQEGEDFLEEVLSHDPDPEARELVPQEYTDADDSACGGLQSWQEEYEAGDDSAVLRHHFDDETFLEEGEEGDEDEDAFGMPPTTRTISRGHDMDMDVDEDEDAFM